MKAGLGMLESVLKMSFISASAYRNYCPMPVTIFLPITQLPSKNTPSHTRTPFSVRTQRRTYSHNQDDQDLAEKYSVTLEKKKASMFNRKAKASHMIPKECPCSTSFQALNLAQSLSRTLFLLWIGSESD